MTAVTATLTPAPSAELPPPASPRGRGLAERLSAYAYIAPFFVLFGVFGLFPLAFTFYVALFDWNPIGDQVFIGTDNFTRMFADPRFWNAAGNTVSIWALSTIPQLLLALVLAHVLNNARLRFALFFRMSVMVPYITSVAATAVVFAQLFDRDYGLLNWLLGLVGVEPVDFVQSTWGSHVLIATMVTWRWFGYTTLLYLASLQSVPRAVFEAAAIDGAGPWQRFRHITVPSLRPVIIFTVVTSTIGGLQIFTEPLLTGSGLTCGAVRQCQTLTLFLYEQGFGQFEFGYGSAIGVALFVMVVAIAAINFVLSTRIKADR
ncbi:cellobiose transport system permease protein [Saccharothrix ecbatanensis]|uniref:Cellobiose transport system permease protein n=1 Tax=Saccharothrix ecbatanensis TaxID=1105145 RepID=A0A7W9HEU3_9PSEU|nr:sugar ABC transporter permease [Saccharothrix ecbatanensis]MBB5800973.1 cellobiose transport system permease protein [Saccharothrix ecbatanensis]